jgi:DNA-binding beta-propeller fold protein YncE
MLKITKKISKISALFAAYILLSCTPEKEQITVSSNLNNGVFIVNEGPYGSGTGTVSFFDHTSKSITNDLFGKANNNTPLGNVVQSMNIINGYAYIVVNNGNKIEIANANNFKSAGTITGLNQPRYIYQVNDTKAYISEWGADGKTGAIKVLNLTSNTVTKTIATGKGTEKMLKKGNYVYVTCKGGYGYDTVVTVIDFAKDSVVKSIAVGPNPNSIQEDADGNLWVLCSGKNKSDYSGLEINGRLVKIDPSINSVLFSITFPSTSSQPSDLIINKAKNTLYFNYDGKVYSHTTSANTFDNTAIISKSYYGLGIDPASDIIYAGDAGNFSAAGKLFRYNTNGTLLDSATVGIAPNGFYFK